MKYLFAFFLLTTVACSGSVDGSADLELSENSESYSYDYNINGCKTGEHSFNSRRDYCLGLADDSLNNYCAGDLRCRVFKQECSDLNLNVTCD